MLRLPVSLLLIGNYLRLEALQHKSGKTRITIFTFPDVGPENINAAVMTARPASKETDEAYLLPDFVR